ncbi:hypothetical protein M2451_002733 [Dysgonomonas sp. PFB1-18]|uniref:hypothetical protein n=1 Tax=unclassified Dysgonomonas TaxID=2630389 RepID=UPI00247332AD|nr:MULTISPECIES: hypothetical protein [unclassified Dysgonomonas]MDH6309381.1 hypothetical protein [Dysgonomonas sp. PF1-14]MDH6339754.1 hypothetical protein [Dysgonomonas sp. PF1-16]MDH6381402.1 hypothetical protein [Dysgonomonas sp. PFB1-18]MDH6398617.1 hypothetical protein [Dysgonomonas sp. PF1-23]
MPKKIKDDRVRQGKINRNNEIRKYFEKLYNEGYRYEVIEEKIILKWGLGSSTINMIINESYGKYTKKSDTPDDRQLTLF